MRRFALLFAAGAIGLSCVTSFVRAELVGGGQSLSARVDPHSDSVEREVSAPDTEAQQHNYEGNTKVEAPSGPLAPTIIGSALSYLNLNRHLLGAGVGNDESACGVSVQQKFNCSEVACEDLVPGYINYIDFFYCDAPNVGARIFAFLLLLLWGVFLLHLVESTTNDFFCASLTLAVDALKLSPNVAGVTFLAVGNAACDVIASIAAFATNSPKVGVGTTLGAGIFVTAAVIAVVSFVSDVRLARRSFVRDILFFIITVIYLLIVHWDGVIDLGEAWGFVIIYIVFVGIVAGGRYIRALRNHPADEAVTASETASGTSFLGVTGEEGYSARRLSQEIVDKAGLLNTGKPIQGPPGIGYGSAISTSGAGGYNSEAVAAAAGLTSSPSNGGRMTSVEIAATNNDLLAALDAARSMSLSSSKKKSGIVKEDSRLEIISSRSPNLFAPPSSTSSLHRKADEDDVNVEDDDDESSSRSSYDDEEDEGNDEPETPGGGAGAGSERKGTKDEEEGDGDGDLGGGSGHPSTVVQAPSEEDGGMAATPSKQNKSSKTGAGKAAPDSKGLIKASSGKKSSKKGAKDDGSTPSNASSSSVFMQDLPKKPSRWTRQFLKTQKDLVTTPGPAGGGSGAAAAFQPFQWTRYHKKQLAIELANRLRARGVSMISTPDGRTVDFIDLLTRDPKAAGDLAAAIGTAVTQAAQQQERALSYEEASRAAASGARAALLASAASGRALSTAASIPSGSLLTAAGDASGGYSSLASSETDTTALITTSASGGISGTPATTGAAKTAKSSDYLSILPHETIKPVADCYLRMKRCLQFVYPAWHSFMVIAELPVVVARKLTVPTLHEGAYRRRLLCIVMPFSMAFFVLILTTHILKGSANSESGFPLWMIGFLVGGVVGIALHFILPVKKEHSHPQKEENDGAQVQQSLLSSPGAKAATIITEPAKTSHPHHHHHHQKKRPWYKRLGIAISGPNDHPLPRGVIFGFLMIMSFLLALFWLLVIANEIVGTALFIGKVLSIPDVVMGLTVLAVGNSINDLAASLTIARDGYASMAVAGAYAGPMFNVLAGIGLPMILACSKADSKSYDIGKPTLLTFLAYGALLTSLTVTLVWVPFEQWRITHRIGRFLCAWFFLFVALVVILGFAGVSKGDVVVAG